MHQNQTVIWPQFSFLSFPFFFCVVFVHVSVYIRSCRQFENAFVMALRFQVSDEKGHGDDTSANNLDSTDLGIKKKSISTTHMCTQTRLVFCYTRSFILH